MAITSHLSIETTMQTKFDTDVVTPWGVGPPEIEVFYPNMEDFNVPLSTLKVRFETVYGDSFQASIGHVGNNRHRHIGLMTVRILGELNAGDGNILAFARAVELAFRAISEDGITYRTPRVERVGRNGDRYQVNVLCPWFADVFA